MLTRKILSFNCLIALLLLCSYSVMGKSVITVSQVPDQQTEQLGKTHSGIHSNMLQPQLVQINATPDHSVKQISSGVGVLSFSDNHLIVSQPFVFACCLFQDVNRCESVSRLLFPYHIFW